MSSCISRVQLPPGSQKLSEEEGKTSIDKFEHTYLAIAIFHRSLRRCELAAVPAEAAMVPQSSGGWSAFLLLLAFARHGSRISQPVEVRTERTGHFGGRVFCI